MIDTEEVFTGLDVGAIKGELIAVKVGGAATAAALTVLAAASATPSVVACV